MATGEPQRAEDYVRYLTEERRSLVTARPPSLSKTQVAAHGCLPPQAFDPDGRSLGWPGRHLQATFGAPRALTLVPRREP
ncbi:hypothetical protein RHS02_08978, partial [Rhizoctonia solani]